MKSYVKIWPKKKYSSESQRINEVNGFNRHTSTTHMKKGTLTLK